jgi:hypothetical protein
MVIAGYPLYAGAVMCFSASSRPDDDPPHPASRRAERSQAVEDLLTAREGSVRVGLRKMTLAMRGGPTADGGGRAFAKLAAAGFGA